jgi:MFS family permease
VGQGALVPVVLLFVSESGGSLAAAALASAMLVIGQFLANLPAGLLVDKVGERLSMYGASAVTAGGALACALVPDMVVVYLGVFVIGASASVFGLARHAYMTVTVPVQYRGRALALLAGSNRLGQLVGPILGAGVIAVTGRVAPAFYITALMSLAVGLLLWSFRSSNPAQHHLAASGTDPLQEPPARIWHTFRDRGDVLLRVGASAAVMGMMRISRKTVIPLFGILLGLGPSSVAFVVGLCAALDFGHFYLGGVIMDRYGRLWAGLPTMATFFVTHIVLALATQLPAPVAWYVGASALMSVANGLTSGFVATMGSDLAPMQSPAAFLSAWRQVTEIGSTAAPFIIAALTASASLAAASLTMAGNAFVGLVLMARYVPRYLPPAEPSRATAHGAMASSESESSSLIE